MLYCDHAPKSIQYEKVSEVQKGHNGNDMGIRDETGTERAHEPEPEPVTETGLGYIFTLIFLDRVQSKHFVNSQIGKKLLFEKQKCV